EHHDPRILARLAATDPIEIVIDSANDIDGAWRAYVAGAPGARRVDVTADWTSYAVPRTGALAPGPETGKRLAVAAIATTTHVPDLNHVLHSDLATRTNAPDTNAVLDGDLETRWHSPSQRGGETITIDLGRPQSVAAIELCL